MNVKGADLFQPLRAVMIGQLEGLELKVVVELIPRKALIQKADQAVQIE